MTTSEDIKELFTALSKFQAAVQPVPEDGKNPHFKSTYATLSSLLQTIRKPLEDAGLVFTQHPSMDGLITRVLHIETAQWMESCLLLTSDRKGPQAAGSAITYARRYALGSILGLSTEEDDDANSASPSKKAASQAPAGPLLTEEQYQMTLAAIMDGDYDKAQNVLQKFEIKKEWKAKIEKVLFEEKDKSLKKSETAK